MSDDTRNAKTRGGNPGLRAICFALAGRLTILPHWTGGRKSLPPVSAYRLGWRGIWLGSALGRAVQMTDLHFANHRQAALALLNGNCRLSRKAGQFLGQLAVESMPMSDAQAGWLAKLLEQHNLPPLAREGAQ